MSVRTDCLIEIEIHKAVVAQGGESLAELARAVAIGIALPDGAVDLFVQHHNSD